MNREKPGLGACFRKAVASECNGIGKAAVMFSGGIDSALMARAVSLEIPKTALFAAGFSKSPARKSAGQAARQLRLPLKTTLLSEKALEKEIPKIKKTINSSSQMQLEIALPLYFALKAARSAKFGHVFTGMGADELFLGYDYFRRAFNGKNASEIRALQLEKLALFWENDFKRDSALAESLSLELHAPFLFPAFMKKALALPVKQNLHSSTDLLRKHALRSLALQFGIPKEIAFRRKKAIQYDSGASKAVKLIMKQCKG
ncbi:MAG: hypothetical protein JW744_03460 [Candidatus Diapherotrites archaeon]|uniref:Asparagine synthetase domain-containing protein n=1 Tax=Candidatus Iainarchaeum sp. TaxID=3101447 RepID=A0A938YX85_9ARCH|nr:hypothetical protein [Candidatus Diapherotrites archaeon]